MPRSRRNSPEAIAKRKEAKQKKLLYFLIPVFLGLAVWQGPKMFGALFGGEKPPEATPAAATTPTDTTAVPPGTAPPAAPAGELADTDVPPEADVAKLISFSLFTGRDPFVSPHPPLDTSPAPTPTAPVPSSDPGSSGGGTGGDQDEELTAVIETNGVSETVSVGEEFPASDPTFTLAALTLDHATIGVVQGIFENGDATIKIKVGEKVTLIAAPDTTQFVVKLVDVMN